jgi:hypothetical protein
MELPVVATRGAEIQRQENLTIGCRRLDRVCKLFETPRPLPQAQTVRPAAASSGPIDRPSHEIISVFASAGSLVISIE